MPSVCADEVGFCYSDRVCLLDQMTFRFDPGWYGLVGANGMGKTTLARLIAGELRPTTGRLWLEPPDSTVTLVSQELTSVTQDIADFAKSDAKSQNRYRGLLGLDRKMLEHFARLSPGERKRWQLASALCGEPEVLIVDEPTNHLDQEGRQLLLSTLQRFLGIGIVISHDRDFLDALTTRTLRLAHGKLAIYPGGYSAARALWLAESERVQEGRQRLRQREQALRARIDTVRRDKDAAHQERSAGSRMKHLHDHDGSCFARTGRAANAESKLSRRLSVMGTELQRLRAAIPEFAVDKTLGRSLFVGYSPAPKRTLLSLVGADLAVGERTLLRDVNVALDRDAKVHLRGPNGSGKTTLLESLLSSATTDPSRLLYLPQELSEDQVGRLHHDVLGLDCEARGRLLSLLAALGVDPERILGSGARSPGEARKLKLAFGLSTHVWALILDEPTNHLDLPSIERLEQALCAYPGALLLVSHDAAFARSCTNQSWEIRSGRVML